MVLNPALRTLLVSTLACAGLGLAPAVASATDLSVSPTGSDSGMCLAKAPCKTITYALGKTASGDRVVVRAGSYNEQVTLSAGRTIAAAAGARPTLDGGAGNAIIMSGAQTRVEGLRIRGDLRGILVSAAADGAEVVDNVFDDAAANEAAKVAVSGSPAVTIIRNRFINVAAGSSLGLWVNTTGTIDIGDNTFEDFYRAVTVANYHGVGASVHGNTISGVHGDGSQGYGIEIDGTATVSDNVVGGVGNTGATNPAHGISVRAYKTAAEEIPAVGVTRRNRVFGFGYAGILASVGVPGSSLTSQGDVLTGNGSGIQLYGNAVVTGATIYDSTFEDVYLSSDSLLDLRSSIVGAGGIEADNDAHCAITTSRGPTTSGDDCETFQTSATPGFVSPDDYHLTASSPLIDAGDPAAPAAGEADIDGNARAVASTAATACAPRRDMGAYEFVPAHPFDCPVAVTPPGDQTPPTDPTPPTTTDQTPPPNIPLSPPAAGGGVVVLADEAKRLTVAIDGAESTTLAPHAVSPVRPLPLGTHTVRIALPGTKKPVTARVTLRDGQLAAFVATVEHGRLAVRTVAIARGTRRLVSLLSGIQRVKLGTAKKTTRLNHGAFTALPRTATKLTVGTRHLALAKTSQLTVLVPKGRAVKTVARHA